jgi:hypothetical protein
MPMFYAAVSPAIVLRHLRIGVDGRSDPTNIPLLLAKSDRRKLPQRFDIH